ncbi:hypothetical protein HU200_045681 [Digitaria exilis]|uniref:UDP-glucuronic acid decarboxylase 1 n=1 Tax=Digitaria exilis TaxID=1010633 RepID=A0A835AZJ7_9POAL|nr:hypothetical protein HU200_045681 [Digitaria exilis]
MTPSSELIHRGGGHDAHPAADEAAAATAGHYPSPNKPPHGKAPLPPWLARPLRYVAGEQRLLFTLLGMALASLVFLLAPSSSSSSSSAASVAAVGLAARHSGGSSSVSMGAVARHQGRVPLGLKRKGLRVVVTGGAGFVGSHLVDRLMERGDSVIVVDNLFTGRKENVLHHAGNPRFEMIRHDVVEPILLEVDQIYHLACPASPVHYKHNPVKTIKTNVVGTLNMLGLAKRVGARFLLTSTSEVYGDPLQHPQVETYWGNVNPIGVRSCYDEGKRTAETLTMDYHRGANLEVRIARIFNTYGPRMCIDDGRVVSNFVAQVEGLMKLMEGDHVGPFNLGNPGEFTMLELAKVVQDTIDPNARIEFRPNTADDPHKRKPDITRAKDMLGWEPKISLRKGLPLMVQDFRNRIFGDQQQQHNSKEDAGDH